MGRRKVATEQQQPHADQHAGNAQDAAPEPSNKRRRRSGVAASGDVSMTSPDVSASTKNQAAKAAKATKAAKTKQSKPSSADGTAAIGAAADEDGMQHVTSQAKQKSKAAAEKPPFYLVKSEPHEFSVTDLEGKPQQTEGWEGVRNAQARNFLKGMAEGDLAFFYHSSCKVPGIVGIVKVVREAYPDATAFDSASKYYDANSTKDNPKWFQVDFQLVRKLDRQITLEELKGHKESKLAGMALFNRPRLSVQPVSRQHWEAVLALESHQQPGNGVKS